jgi:leucyl aminopeptidase
VNCSSEAAGFSAAARQFAEVLAPVGLDVQRLLLVGVGDADTLPRHEAEQIGATLATRINASAAQRIHVDSRLIRAAHVNAHLVAAIAHGVDLRNYRFDQLKGEPDARPAQHYHWQVVSDTLATQHHGELRALAEGVFTARELTNLPGADGHPAAFAEYAAQRLTPLGVEVTILTPEQVQEAGMGSLYSVSRGSQHGSYLLVSQWQGGGDEPPIALVGKGNTFDTGGYNLKTNAASILEMQGDKAGGAAVVGAMMAVAAQQLPLNVVGIVPLSQNAISGEATLPGDVVTAGDGTTIEVANTDAEGRLILADGIWYARDRFQPRIIADIATLTGAKRTALGTQYSAMFSEHQPLLDAMQAAGELTAERVWPLPLAHYPGIIDSNIADIRNTGTPGAQAGAIFLQHFAADTPWIHIDMAGQALVSAATGIHPAGATGHGVRLLAEWLRLGALGGHFDQIGN